MGDVTVTSGVRDVLGSRLAYEIYTLSGAARLSGLLLLHGFGANRESLAGHARRLAAAGVAAVLTPDMSSLMAGGTAVAQQRNIEQAADFAAWFARQPALAGGPGVVLAGHSAGGAVLFEAAAALAAAGTPPRALCLLDGVPWSRTAAAAPTWPAREVPLLALRGANSSWNASGAMQSVLAALPPPGACVAFLPRSRHGDALDPKRNAWALRLAGLLGPPECSVLIAQLLDAYVADAVSSTPGRFEDGPLAALAAAHPRDLVVERRRGQLPEEAPPAAAGAAAFAAS